MKPEDLDFLIAYVRRCSGISLDAGKAYLVKSRLLPLARELGLPDLGALVAALRQGTPAVGPRVVECMTTNETLFFRDARVFEYLQSSLLPQLIKRSPEDAQLRIWCAACSSGQEPYSIAMILDEQKALLGGRTIEILASDISRPALARATAGEYTDFEINRGLPVHYRDRYFVRNEKSDRWIISPQLRRMVTFRYFNLINDMRPLGSFHIIFLRNVLLYFEAETKESILVRLYDCFVRGGSLFLGSVETVGALNELYRPVPGVRGVFEVAGTEHLTDGRVAHSKGSAMRCPGHRTPAL